MSESERVSRITLALLHDLKKPEEWWWLSFAGDDGRWLGVAVVRATGMSWAIRRTHELGINPGGEVRAAPIPHPTDPPAALVDRLIADKEELDRLTREWTGEGLARL